MTVQFIGMIASEEKSEIHPARGPVIDPDYIVRFARAHEDAGFDRVLIAHNSSDADAVLVATHAAQNTSKLGFMIAHRPGFIAPTYAARLFATFDVLSGGRGGIHIISGGDSVEQRRDGDFLSHEDRYRRTDEYVGLLRQTWTAEAPFTHEGAYYRVENAFARVKPIQKPHIPVYFGGSSDLATRSGVKPLNRPAIQSARCGQPVFGWGGTRTASSSACRCGPCWPRRKTMHGAVPTGLSNVSGTSVGQRLAR